MNIEPRRTKIVATLGPASTDENSISALLDAGANVFRLNFSHGNAEEHLERATLIRKLAKQRGCYAAILGDLQGPKIRVARFKTGAAKLTAGQPFILDASFSHEDGDEERVGIDYEELPKDVVNGDILLLDDGRIQLRVSAVQGTEVHTVVTVPGVLKNNKGINKQQGGLSAAALTEKDKADIITAAAMQVDYLAVSFPRSANDIELARNLAIEAGLDTLICAKVERAEVVKSEQVMDQVIMASDAIMVARGDLGVEIGDAELVGVQKQLIARSRQLNKVVITATQMMESMIENPLPTRAEVMDVANAVLDGTDAVMLSGETAVGAYPAETVAAMSRVCIGAETHPRVQVSKHRIDQQFTDMSEAVAMAAMYAANHYVGVKAIVGLTESGSTVKLMSRITTSLPILALSRHASTLQKISLYRGVIPIAFDSTHSLPGELTKDVVAHLVAEGSLTSGDTFIFTYGDQMETVGATNTCKLVQVP